MNNMKNNKQNKKNIVIALSIILCLIICNISAYAYTDTSTNGIDFQNQPITKWSQSPANVYYNANSEHIFVVASYQSGNYTYRYGVWQSAGTEDVYVFSYSANSKTYIECVTASTNQTICFNVWNGADYAANYTSVTPSSFRSDYSLYSSRISLNDYWYDSSYIFDIPVFNSEADGLTAAKDWIDNPPAPAPSAHPLQFILPAGNIFIANVSGTESSILLGMHTPLLSWNPPVSQYMGFFSSIPSDLSIPISGTTPINWQKAGKKDILGRTSNWVANSYVSNQNFVIITNPLNQDASQYSSNSNNLEVSAANADITINMSSVIEYRVYSLSQQFNITTGDWNVSQGEQSFSGNYDDTSQTWVTTDDATGNVSNPSYGGDNTPVVPNSISDWLENIASSISGFFTGAIGAVSNLVSAGSNFINSLQGLYSWLPPQVFSVLASALIIVITIGVIKVFI